MFTPSPEPSPLCRALLLLVILAICLAAPPVAAQAPCNESDTVGGGTLGVSPGTPGPPDSLGWDVGTGQCNGSFVSTTDGAFPGGAIELALRTEQRRIGQVAPTMGNDYEVQLGNDTNAPPATNRAWWNFNLSIAYGGVIADLDALTLQIRTDAGNNLPASPTVDLLDAALRAAIDGRNNQPNATSGFSDLYQISQNPEFGWFMHGADTDANPTGAFNYDEEGAWRMRLSATEAGTEVAAEMCIHTPNASCVFPLVGAAKLMTPQDMTLPATIQITYSFENFGSETMLGLGAIDDLSAVFGVFGLDWTFTSISSVPVSLANPSFNGSVDTELIQQAPSQDLAIGNTGTITVMVELQTTAAADINGEFCNQITVTGRDSLGASYQDLSVEGTDPDADGDANPTEESASCFSQTDVPVTLQSFSID